MYFFISVILFYFSLRLLVEITNFQLQCYHGNIHEGCSLELKAHSSKCSTRSFHFVNDWNIHESLQVKPVKSSHESSTDAPGKYLPKSTTVVTPLIKASLLALFKASLLSSLETSGMLESTSFIAESISNPVGSAKEDQKIIKISMKILFSFDSGPWNAVLIWLDRNSFHEWQLI